MLPLPAAIIEQVPVDVAIYPTDSLGDMKRT